MKGKRLYLPIGSKFGNWITIAEPVTLEKNGHKYGYVLCECQCEKHTRKLIYTSSLIREEVKSCGCLPHKTTKGKKLSEDHKRKVSESMKLAHAQKRAHNIGERHWKGESSPAEKEFLDIIHHRFDDIMVVPEMQFHLFNLDFAWPHKKKCIELDGEQHFRFESYRLRDARKNNALTREDWLYLRIPLKDFYADKEMWIQKANTFIGLPLTEEEFIIKMKQIELDKTNRNKGNGLSRINQLQQKSPSIIKHNYCLDCGAEINSSSKRCRSCYSKAHNKIEWPQPDELEKMFAECESLEELGRRLGVSGNSIKKKMKSLGVKYIPKKHKGNAKNFMTQEARAKAKIASIEYARKHPKKIPLIGQYTKEGDLVRTYASVRDIKHEGFDPSGVSKVIRGVLKSYKGFIWKRIS